MVGQRDMRGGKGVGHLFLQGMPSKKVDVVAGFERASRHVSQVHVSSTNLVRINTVAEKMHDARAP